MKKRLPALLGCLILTAVSGGAMAYVCPSPREVGVRIDAAIAAGQQSVFINTPFGVLTTLVTSLHSLNPEEMGFYNAAVLYTLDGAAEEPITVSCAYTSPQSPSSFIPLYVYSTGTTLLYKGLEGRWSDGGSSQSAYLYCFDSDKGCVFVSSPPPLPPRQ